MARDGWEWHTGAHSRLGGLVSASPIVAVFGSSTFRVDDRPYQLAHDLGRELARQGATVMTGGYAGVMEACSRGAHEAGGHVIGVTVELYEKRGRANRWIRERIHTPDLFERLRHLMTRPDGYVVLPGSVGTCTALFLAWPLLPGRARPRAPLILLSARWNAILDAHRGEHLIPEALFHSVRIATSPAEAARAALATGATRSAGSGR